MLTNRDYLKIGVYGCLGEIGQKFFESLVIANVATHVVGYNRSPRLKGDKLEAWLEGLDDAAIVAAGQGEKMTRFEVRTEDADLEGNVIEKGAINDPIFHDCDVIVVAAGEPRDPSKPRSDLLFKNASIVERVAPPAKRQSPNALVILATNPADANADYFQHLSDFNPNKILSLSGELDRSRLIRSIRKNLKVAPENVINAQVVGQHGDGMVPVLSGTYIRSTNGSEKNIYEYLQNDPKMIDRIIKDTISGGAALGKKRGKNDVNGPTFALMRMVCDFIAADNGHNVQPLYASAYVDGIHIGHPVKPKANFEYDLAELQLSHSEKVSFKAARKLCHDDVAMLVKTDGLEIAA